MHLYGGQAGHAHNHLLLLVLLHRVSGWAVGRVGLDDNCGVYPSASPG